jgi:hypothetical protein
MLDDYSIHRATPTAPTDACTDAGAGHDDESLRRDRLEYRCSSFWQPAFRATGTTEKRSDDPVLCVSRLSVLYTSVPTSRSRSPGVYTRQRLFLLGCQTQKTGSKKSPYKGRTSLSSTRSVQVGYPAMAHSALHPLSIPEALLIPKRESRAAEWSRRMEIASTCTRWQSSTTCFVIRF